MPPAPLPEHSAVPPAPVQDIVYVVVCEGEAAAHCDGVDRCTAFDARDDEDGRIGAGDGE
jgi:hypothetical protein